MKKRIIALLMALLMIMSFTSCKSSSKKDSKKIRIVLDWTPNTNHTGLYVAQEKGYFKDLGLDVEIMQPPEGSTTQLVAAGGAEFGISFQDTLAKAYASDTPLPVTAVAAILQHNTSGIISLKDEGIDRPSALCGHSYATWEDPIELAIIKQIVEADGGNYDDIELVPNTVTDVVTALQTDVQSVWVYKAWDGIATEVAGLDTNFINFADYGEELDYYSPVLIANNDYLENNPDQVKKVLEAIEKGYEYAIDNPEEAADILLEAAPENSEELVKASQEWISRQYKAEVSQWGYINPERWNKFYDWLYENNLVDQKIEENFGFTNDYLPK